MKKLTLATALTLLAAPAMAHPGHGFGFTAGLLHPLTGADHMLAMLAVGLWSGLALPRRIWAGAATFMAAMTAGAGLAMAGLTLPGVEGMIAASVLVLGLMVAFARQGQTAMLTLIALFAAAHGFAHGAEASGAVLPYLGGMLAATAGLHLAGLTLAARVARHPIAQRLLGAGLAGSGLFMLDRGMTCPTPPPCPTLTPPTASAAKPRSMCTRPLSACGTG
jgi:urease accessory protein